MQDLFETPEKLPQQVQDIIYSCTDESYEECKRMLSELNAIGYTFDYGLDAIPYNLRKLTNKKINKYERNNTTKQITQ